MTFPALLQVWPTGGTALRVIAGGTSVTAAVIDRGTVPERWRDGVVARLETPTAKLAAKPAKALVSIDYAKFRTAYGADWSSRLKLWQLPECALTTPDADGCSPVPLRSRNDSAISSVSADVAVGSGTLVALAAEPAGDSGDFTKSSLSASTTWSAGGSSGDFTWSYPLRTPPGIGGEAPELSVGYSSGSVDGRSSASNSQPSSVGEGFGLSQSFIERSYVSCNDDKAEPANNPTYTGDLCWRNYNASLSLGNRSTELLTNDPDRKTWHGRSEDGSRIERLTGAENGDENGEYWKVTTTDGVQYFFGLNKLPGQSSATGSALTVPVYGNHPNEPGHDDTFAASRETQAWRWNLDYVIDTHGNTTSYWYDQETNQYAAEGTSSKNVSYVRDGVLRRIDYGTWDRGASDRSVAAKVQVVFDPADRCLTDCATHGGNWPDTPWDQECAASATSCTDYSPTFWSTKRLAKVTTRVYDAAKTVPGWQDVDSYTFTHSFPSPGDGQRPGLWLDSIVHTGLVGGSHPMPPVSFDPVSLPNRVLTKHNTTNNWQRLAAIRLETGGLIQVTYSDPDCGTGNLPAAPESNTKLCYPVVGPDPNSTSGGTQTEYWHKYVVRKVTQTDVQLAGGHQAPTMNTYYTYEGSPAWHYADDDGLSKPKYKTWNQFRGYATVATRVGDSNQTLTRTTYLRGMHLDRAGPSGGTRTVTVPASLGSETVYDEDQYVGMVREEVVYNGTTDKPVSKTVNVPWRSAPLVTRTINGDTAEARFVNTATTYAGTALGVDGARGWRVTSTQSQFDETYGTVKSTQDNGDLARTGDEKCTTTTYNRNTTTNLVVLPKRKTVTTLTCGTAPTAAEQVGSDELTFYDGATSVDTVPAKGAATRTDVLKDWSTGSGTSWLTSKVAQFDAWGRQTSTKDVRGNVVTTAFSPVGQLAAQRVDTNKLGWATTTAINPAWGSSDRVTDPNGRVSEGTYDPLGRTKQVWSVGWTKAAHPNQPSLTFTYSYAPGRDGYPYVKTEALNDGGGTDVSYEIYDGFLRSRQTQKAAVGGGRVVTDTLMDAHGHKEMEFGAHAEPGNPSGTLWWEPEWSVPTQTLNVYDRAGRPTDIIFRSGDDVTNIVEKWRTTTKYEGDSTTIVAPKGTTPTTSVVDALGRQTELRQYTTAAGTAGPYDTTKYAYDARGQLSTVTDAKQNEWVFGYDVRGRQSSVKDPDKGTTRSFYDDADDLIKTVDARNETLVYTYDVLGRKTAIYDDAATEANKRTEWTYDVLSDDSVVKGELTEWARYDLAADGTRQPYRWQVRNFTGRGEVAGAHWAIPSNETGLGGTYVYGYTYSPYTGKPAGTSFPDAGGLPAEAVTTKFDATSGLPRSLTSGWSDVGTYVSGQQYTAYGEPEIRTMKLAGKVYAQQATEYERDTRRVHRVQVKPESTGTVSDRVYTWQASGDLLSIADTPEVGQADSQCFAYDPQQRLTSAWTPKTGVTCGTTPTLANLGGPAPYWLDWTFDKLGNRTQEVSHAAAGDTTRDFAVPTAGGPAVVRPHGVTGMTTTAPGQSATTVAFGYDDAGNMNSRPGPSGPQTLQWDAEGHLAKIVESSGTTTNLYDADGTRLIRRDAAGSTLYLPGMEVRRVVNGGSTTVRATRYYSFNGATVASRTPGARSLSWLFDDHQGTQQVAMNADTQVVSVRRQTPYGGSRGTPPAAWPNTKGFVGGDTDPIGLTHLGAREYDPMLGRFISVDPVQDLRDPQQWNAYAYATNNPITRADPGGKWVCGLACILSWLIDVVIDVIKGGDTGGGDGGGKGNSNGGNGNSGGNGSGGGKGSGGSGNSSVVHKPKVDTFANLMKMSVNCFMGICQFGPIGTAVSGKIDGALRAVDSGIETAQNFIDEKIVKPTIEGLANSVKGAMKAQSDLLGLAVAGLIVRMNGRCTTQDGMTVCRENQKYVEMKRFVGGDGQGLFSLKAGTTIGGTFIANEKTPLNADKSVDQSFLNHEKWHRDEQWEKYGLFFAVLYLSEEKNKQTECNRYEVDAERNSTPGGAANYNGENGGGNYNCT
ncbi:RHS repeat-associated core domain-containing protein [Actinoplanes solisilvae]|uniref:RHS repeat-associated core domain-containing protein n=1 Tax=Actinoplanes solisilvae TaxID=2486853 RepID=UPI000FDCB606|nr:RHS repeat-associated core domain-containing protein [Actinoplanes solisilvae]